MCVIITDGKENASREFTSGDVKKRIRHQQDVYKWDFQFLAANQDAFATGESMGLDRASCMDFVSDAAGVKNMCMSLACRVDNLRHGKKKK